MPRQRKRVISGKLYQILFRARRDIPLPPTRTINLIIESALARAQQVYPVILTDLIFMGNHPHIFAIPLDADDFKNFYGLVEKELTEAIKKLTGIEYLNIWEGSPKVTMIASKEDLVTELGYVYANPATANLEDTIEKYPGVSTWYAFREAEPVQTAVTLKKCPWVRRPMLKKLPARSLNAAQDRFSEARLKRKARKHAHILKITPNAWAKALNIPDEELPDVRSDIFKEVRKNEDKAREKREEKGKSVVGKYRLQRTPILSPHRPTKKGPSLCVIAQDPEYRASLLNDFRNFCDLCRWAYDEWKKGNMNVEWPPGAYKPPPPRTVNYLASSIY